MATEGLRSLNSAVAFVVAASGEALDCMLPDKGPEKQTLSCLWPI